MITAHTVDRFVQAASAPRPYEFLKSLAASDTVALMCRKHRVSKTPGVFGPQLTVCPEGFPAEALA